MLGNVIYLSQSGTGKIQGRVTFVRESNISDRFDELVDQHRIKDQKEESGRDKGRLVADVFKTRYKDKKKMHGWVFKDPVPFEKEISYARKRGQVNWRAYQPAN